MKGIAAALALALLAACGREEAPAPAPGPPPPATTRDSVASEIRTVGGLQARRTDVLGIVADLLSATREEGTLTVGVRFRNAGSDSLSITIPGEGVRLTAGDRDWPVARQEDGDPAITETFVAELAPGSSRLWRASFVAPPPAVHSFELELPGVQPFTDVPITDEERSTP